MRDRRTVSPDHVQRERERNEFLCGTQDCHREVNGGLLNEHNVHRTIFIGFSQMLHIVKSTANASEVTSSEWPNCRSSVCPLLSVFYSNSQDCITSKLQLLSGLNSILFPLSKFSSIKLSKLYLNFKRTDDALNTSNTLGEFTIVSQKALVP